MDSCAPPIDATPFSLRTGEAIPFMFLGADLEKLAKLGDGYGVRSRNYAWAVRRPEDDLMEYVEGCRNGWKQISEWSGRKDSSWRGSRYL